MSDIPGYLPELVEPACTLRWQMATCERFALSALLQRLRPKLSLEIGTYLGGSLQVLAKYSQRVISIDIDPQVATTLSPQFPNVDFRSGDSAGLLPGVISEMNHKSETPAFVLIDGDHSRAGVRRDIEAVLALTPKERTVVILHDSFNPECREGMRTANWDACPLVHAVELDYIPGIYQQEAYDTAAARTMWGGFACAVLEPFPRTHALVVRECQRGLFETMFQNSSHIAPRQFQRVRNFLRKLSEI